MTTIDNTSTISLYPQEGSQGCQTEAEDTVQIGTV